MFKPFPDGLHVGRLDLLEWSLPVLGSDHTANETAFAGTCWVPAYIKGVGTTGVNQLEHVLVEQLQLLLIGSLGIDVITKSMFARAATPLRRASGAPAKAPTC